MNKDKLVDISRRNFMKGLPSRLAQECWLAAHQKWQILPVLPVLPVQARWTGWEPNPRLRKLLKP